MSHVWFKEIEDEIVNRNKECNSIDKLTIYEYDRHNINKSDPTKIYQLEIPKIGSIVAINYNVAKKSGDKAQWYYGIIIEEKND